MINNDILTKVFENEDFKAETAKIKTAEDLRELLLAYNVDVTLDDVYDICRQISDEYQGNEELTTRQLESVAGGVFVIPWAVAGAVCLGATALGIWNGYHETKHKCS